MSTPPKSPIQNSSLRKHPLERLQPENASDIWTLWYAAKNGKLSRVEKLLAKGTIDINASDEDDGRTALHWAVRNNHLDVVRLLLDSGASINLADKVVN